MLRRHWYHLVALLLVSLAVRYAAIDYVGMWVDHGFYSYDSRLILEGKRPFIDFLGRSPAFLYLLAGWRALVGYSPTAFRMAISVIWVATALPVYGLARKIADHRSAMVSAAAFLLLPYGVVYGLWFNTMSLAALCSTTALWLVACRDTRPAWAVAGVLLSVAFLSRRSVVVLAPAILGYVAIRAYDNGYSIEASANRVAAIGAGGVGTLAVGYLLLAYGDFQTARALLEIHAINLFATTGRGGWPMVGVSVDAVGNTVKNGRIPIFNDLCQLCGRWTARTLAKSLLVTVPVVGVVSGTALSWLSDVYLDERVWPYFSAALLSLAGWAAVVGALAGFPLRVGTVVAMVLLVIVAFRVGALDVRLRDRPVALLCALCLAAFVAGYLYRERVLHVYYGMDLWPLLSVFAGVAGVALWRRADRPLRAVFAVALVIAVVTSGVAAYPLANIVVDDNSAGWFTPDLTQEYAADVDSRTEPGDYVITKTSTYIAGSHARMPLDDSRSTGHIYSTFSEHPDAGPRIRLYKNLTSLMRSGDASLVVLDSLTKQILAANETTRHLFQSKYCRVDDAVTQRLYAQTNATLFKHGDCAQSRRPNVTG